MEGEDEKDLMLPEDYPDKGVKEDEKKSCMKYLGIPLLVTSAFFYSSSSLTVKLIQYFDAMELLMFRFSGLFLLTLPIVLYNKQTLFPRDLKDAASLCSHSVAAATIGICSFYAFRHMPLGDASALCFSTPLFVAILDLLLMREKCSVFTWCLVSMTLSGVVLVSKPESLFGSVSSYDTDATGVVAAISSSFFRALSFLSLKLCKNLHYSVILCHFGLTGLIFTSIYGGVTQNFMLPSKTTDYLVVVLLAILGFLGQLILTVASRVESPSTMSICRSSDILFSFLFQTIIFHQNPDSISILGALLIVASVCLVKFKPQDKKT